MSTAFEDLLRQELSSAAPPAGVGHLDPDEVIGEGTRVVRRRRVGALAAVAALAVATVTGLAWDGGRDRATVPADHPTTTAPSGRATLSVPDNHGGTQRYAVSIGVRGTNGPVVTFEPLDGSPPVGTDGTALVPGKRGAAWVQGADTRLVLGVVPSERARQQLLVDTGRGTGGYAWEVTPIPGTGYAAFGAHFDDEHAGDPVTSVIWFDAQGRPVLPSGEVGSAARLSDVSLWVTADGALWGTDGYSKPVDRSHQAQVGGTGGARGSGWLVYGLLPAGARDASALGAGGSVLPVEVAPLEGTRDAAFAVVVPGTEAAALGSLTSITWTDASGTHTEDLTNH